MSQLWPTSGPKEVKYGGIDMDEEREKYLNDSQTADEQSSQQEVEAKASEEKIDQKERQPEGEVKIAEEVISQMAIEALKSVPGVFPAS